MDKELVSIITPSYNCSEFIEKTIKSVQNQTYKNWEMLITDDCSTDNSVEIIKAFAFKDPRIKLFQLEKNSGAGVARNKSIEHAQGKYIAFLDSDDKWMPEKLEKQIAFMQEKQCGLSYTSMINIDEHDNEIGIEVAPKRHTLSQNKRDDKVGFSTAVYDQEVVGKIFMPTIRKRQDWGLVLSVLKKCKVAYGIKQPLAYYRIGHDSLSKNKLALVKYNIAAYKSVLGWSSLRAHLFFSFVYLPSYLSKKLFLKMINNY